MTVLAERIKQAGHRRERGGENSDFESKHPRGPGGLFVSAGTALTTTVQKPPELPGITVVVDDSKTEGGLGASDGHTIWVKSFAPPFTRRHEEGHVFDSRYMTDADRAAFMEIIGRTGEPWWGGDYSNGVPAEWFADVYGQLATMRKKIVSRAGYTAGDGLISGEKLARAAELIRQISERAGLV